MGTLSVRSGSLIVEHALTVLPLPLCSLYFFAPICLAINAALIIPVEGLAALAAIPKLGLFTILSNCLLTLALNLSCEPPSPTPLLSGT